MKKLLTIFIAILTLYTYSSIFAANVEKTLGFQGQLFETNAPKTGSVNATFTFYDSLSGGSVTGSPIAKTVTVSNGYFGAQFTESDTAGVDFNQQLYLEVSINGTTLSPRTTINPTVSSLKTFGTFSYASAPTVGPAGSLYFNTSDNTLYTSNGTSWTTASSSWLTSGTSTYYTAGNVGIGTTTPESKLVVQYDDASRMDYSETGLSMHMAAANGIRMFSHTSSGATFRSPGITFSRSGGTEALPEAVGTGWQLGSIFASGHDGTDYSSPSIAIRFYSAQPWTTSAHGSYVTFQTTANDSTSTLERMRIGSNGFVGIGSTAPTSVLTVVGTGISSSTMRLESPRAAIVAGNIISGIDFASNDTSLTAPGTTTASILAIANQTHTASTLGTDLAFNTNNGTSTNEVLRILGNGYVGIGTSTPGTKLVIQHETIDGNISINGLALLLNRPGSTAATSTKNFYISNGDPASSTKSGILDIGLRTDAGAFASTLFNLTYEGLALGRAGSAMNPDAKLTLLGSDVTTSQINIRSFKGAIVAGNLVGGIDFTSNDTTFTGTDYLGIRTASIKAIANSTHTASDLGTDLVFSATANGDTLNTEILRFKRNAIGTEINAPGILTLNSAGGNIGIGTTNPLHALDVYGDCIAYMGSCIGATSSTNLVEYVGTVFQFSEDGSLTNAGTRYLAYAGGTIATTDILSVVITRNGLLKNFYVRADTNTLSGASTFEVLKNGVATGYSVNLEAASTSASNSTTTISVAAGDKISLRVVSLGTGAMARPIASFEQIVTTNVFSTSQWVTSTTSSSTIIYNGTAQLTNLLGGATTLSTDANGNIIRTPSDQKLKTNVETLTSALDKVNQMRGVSYNWIDVSRFGPDKEIGFIAQELETIVPEVVKSGGEYKSVNYQNLTALLTEAIKELSAKFDGLKKLVQTDEVKTKKLCIGDTCITEQEFKQVLQNRNINSLPPTPTPEPEQPVVELEPTPEPIPEPVSEPLPEPVTQPAE